MGWVDWIGIVKSLSTVAVVLIQWSSAAAVVVAIAIGDRVEANSAVELVPKAESNFIKAIDARTVAVGGQSENYCCW